MHSQWYVYPESAGFAYNGHGGAVIQAAVAVDGEGTKQLGGIVRAFVADDRTAEWPLVLADKRKALARNIAKFIDHAALAVTSPQNGETVPFLSVYRTVYETHPEQIIQINKLILPPIDLQDYTIIAHPSVHRNQPDLLAGHEVLWCQSARTSSIVTDMPNGSALVFFIPKGSLLLTSGKFKGTTQMLYRLVPDTMPQEDEAKEMILQARVNRYFTCARPASTWIVEIEPDLAKVPQRYGVNTR